MSIDQKRFNQALLKSNRKNLTSAFVRDCFSVVEAYEAAKTEQPDECRAEFEKWWKANIDNTGNKFGYDKGELEWAWNAAWDAKPVRESGSQDE